MSRESAYRLRRHPGAESFADAWNHVLAGALKGSSDLSLLWHRAFYGTLKPIVRGGQVVATLHRPDNKALMALLNRIDQAERSRARMAARRDQGERSR
jgi:hypothetical protein